MLNVKLIPLTIRYRVSVCPILNRLKIQYVLSFTYHSTTQTLSSKAVSVNVSHATRDIHGKSDKNWYLAPPELGKKRQQDMVLISSPSSSLAGQRKHENYQHTALISE